MLVRAAVFMTCEMRTDSSAELFWTITRGVALAMPLQVTNDMRAYYGVVFGLTPQWEAALRMAEAAIDGPLGAQFPEFGHKAMRCFAMTKSQIEHVMADPTEMIRIRTKKAYALASGISPVAKSALQSIGAQVDDNEIDAQDLEPITLPAPSGSSGLQAAGSMSSVVGGVHERLQSLFKVQEGRCPHRYTVDGILAYLELTALLKPAANGRAPNPPHTPQ